MTRVLKTTVASSFSILCAVILGAAKAEAGKLPAAGNLTPRVMAKGENEPLFQAVNESLDLRSSSVQTLGFAKRSESSLTTAVVVDGNTWTLELQKHSVRSPDFQVWVQDASGQLTLVEPPPVQTYVGTVLELPGSEVRASYRDGEMEAVVYTQDGMFGIQPLAGAAIAAQNGEHAVFRNSDWVNRRGYACAADVGQHVFNAVTDLELPPADAPNTAAVAYKVAQIALDADFEYFQLNASNVNATILDMENVINGLETIYETQLNITYEISSMIVRIDTADPYSSTSPSGLLAELVSSWNASPQSSVPRDLLHLFTGKDLDGSVIGIAYIGAVCNQTWAYGLSQSRFTATMSARVALSAHELGHNWNAQHCNGCTTCTNCCQIMCSGIGGCSGILTSFGCQEVSQMAAFRDTRTCLSTVSLGCTTNADCNDGLYCNGTETCVSGSCAGGSPPNCADAFACTTDSCNESTDLCIHTANNAACNDGLFCNGTETCNLTLGCQAGTAPNCADAVSCTADTCNEATDQCVHTPNDTLCNDGLFCNGTETCNLTLGCQAGTAPNCADAVSCTADTCNEATDQCVHTPNSTLCNDGLFCNGTETCSLTLGCQAGTAPNCADAVPCTTDSCNEATDLCVHTPNNTLCNDALFCNGIETCNALTGCTTGSTPCGTGTCDETADQCVTAGGSGEIWLVFVNTTNVPGIGAAANEDIVAYDLDAGTWSLVFDGSDVGLANLVIDGMAVLPSGDILLSFTDATSIPGLTGGSAGTWVDDSDIVRFVPTSLGTVTAGSFAYYFDGSDVGLATADEDVDAITLTSTGDLVLSTLGPYSVTGLTGDGADLIVLNAQSLGSVTTGSFAMHFDGGDVGLTSTSEAVDGAGLTSDGTVLLSTIGSNSVPGVFGAKEDVLEFTPASLGPATSGTYSMFLDVSTLGISTFANVNALEAVD